MVYCMVQNQGTSDEMGEESDEMDDMTFCLSDCQRTDCYRHPSNIQDRTIPHSYADFTETDTCPSRQLIEKMQLSDEDATKDATLQQDMSGNMSGTHKSLDCISRQAAIDALLNLHGMVATDWHRDKDYFDAVSDAIAMLRNLPSVQPDDAALHESCTDCPLYDHDRHSCPRFNKVIPRTIEEVKPRWIPVTEKLPEDLEAVNITWVNHEPEPYYHDIKDKNFVATGIHYRDKWYWYSTTCADFLGEYGSNEVEEVDDAVEIIAWLPLPEPYKGEQE